MHILLSSENLKGKDHLGDLNVESKTIIRWMLERQNVDWIHLPDDRFLCALVNIIMNVRVPQELGAL
jgi:hypothetical protein